MADKKVEFFIAGVQKGGTTALHAFLSRHPEIQMSSEKEPHFFDDESLDWSDPPYETLHKQFDFSRGLICGEATPIYSYWPRSIERIAAYNPAARIVMVLRQPAHRAKSHWKMETARGSEAWSFRMATSPLGRLRTRWPNPLARRIFSYVDRGFYARQISRILEAFPREQLHVLTSDQLRTKKSRTLEQICVFLGVDDTGGISKSSQRPKGEDYVVAVDSRAVDEPEAQAIRTLTKLYADDIRATMEMTGLDLQDWLDPDYAEPDVG